MSGASSRRGAAYGFPRDLSEEEVVARLMGMYEGLNAEKEKAQR